MLHLTWWGRDGTIPRKTFTDNNIYVSLVQTIEI